MAQKMHQKIPRIMARKACQTLHMCIKTGASPNKRMHPRISDMFPRIREIIYPNKRKNHEKVCPRIREFKKSSEPSDSTTVFENSLIPGSRISEIRKLWVGGSALQTPREDWGKCRGPKRPLGSPYASLSHVTSVARPGSRCAGWAWNPKGRHPTILDLETGIRRRIPARISPWGSRDLNPNFCFPMLDPTMSKSQFPGRVLKLLAPIAMDLGPHP